MRTDRFRRCVGTLSTAVLLLLAAFLIHGTSLAIRNTNSAPKPLLPASDRTPHPSVRHHGALLPLTFEPNLGQTNPQVRFVSNGQGYELFLTPQEAVLALRSEQVKKRFLRKRDKVLHLLRYRHIKASILRLQLEGANPKPSITGIEKLPGKSNYFIGSNPQQWRMGVPSYARVRYQQVYPGVDLVFYGNQHALEYDFLVRPGADPKRVTLGINGAQKLRTDVDGSLHIQVAGGEVHLERPVIYQLESNRRRMIEGRYALLDGHRVTFWVGTHDPSKPLVIDPVLDYSTYLGGSTEDEGQGIAVDVNGDAYIAGDTFSTDFPTTANTVNPGPPSSTGNGAAYVTEINPTGTSVLYSTYFSGNGGEGAFSVALDSSSPPNVFITGFTCSTNFPTTQNAYLPSFTPTTCTSSGTGGAAFVTKFNPSVSGPNALVYSTYLGGTGSDLGSGIAVDGSGNIYVAGSTTSTNFPTTSNAFQTANKGGGLGNGFVTMINPAQTGAASLIYSTYLGGSGNTPNSLGDDAYEIAADSADNAYVVGTTASADFPTTSTALIPAPPGATAGGTGFVSRINTALSGSASLAYSTYLGGSGSGIPLNDSVESVAVGPNNRVYVAGGTSSSNFPVTTGAFQTQMGADPDPAFVTVLDTSQSGQNSLIYSTFVHGSAGEVIWAIAVDSAGNAYVTGDTISSDFPVTPGAFQTTLKSCVNSFVTEIAPAGQGSTDLVYSTYLGGTGDSPCVNGDDAYAIALDLDNSVYVTGYASSKDFPTSPSNAYQTSLNGPSDAFISKLTLPTSLISIVLSPQTSSIPAQTSEQFSALGTRSDGSTVDLTSTANWSSSNTSVASISSINPTQGFAVAINPGSTTISSVYGTLVGTAALTVGSAVTPVSPNITSVTPTSGSGGTQVTIAGTGFGATQGSGYVTLGTTFGQVVGWSNSQIVAKVATGSQTGVVQVQQGGVQSNSINFTISTPVITSVTPTSGGAGTSVTIAGSGFGATQGSGQAWLGNADATVTSWSDTQVVATVVSPAPSGTAQILQNGVWSNAVSFGVSVPQITSVSPASGTSGTLVTITGSGFSATQGSGQVWIGSTDGVVSSWRDTQVTATVASGAVTGIVKIEQGGTWSNSVPFTVPGSGGSSLTLSPNTITMTVGDTHSIEALNAQGQSVKGLTWVSTDTTVVTLSTDDPPILTAAAVGHATITAGNASADVTVSASLSPGTVQWTNPGDGSGVTSVVPAVPSTSGVDVFAFENSGNVTAIKSDGTNAWTANLHSGFGIPAFDGGLVVVGGNQLQELNGTTGQPYSAYTFANSTPSRSLVAVSTDGTVYTVDGDKLIAVDPTTGSVKFSSSMEDSTYSYGPSCEGGSNHNVSFPAIYQLMIAGDGNAYLAYSYSNTVSNPQVITNCNLGFGHEDNHMRLLRVAPDGSSAKFDLGDWKEDWSSDQTGPLVSAQTGPHTSLAVNGLITNADTGVLLSWSLSSFSYCAYTYYDFVHDAISAGCLADSTAYQLSTVSSSGVGTTVLPYSVQPLLQREDGTFVGFAGDSPTSAGNMAAFDQSGAIQWSASNYSPQVVTAGGGVIAQSSDGLTTATFDASGNATGQNPSLSGNSLPNWFGNTAYTVGPGGSVVSTVFTPIDYDASAVALLGGNQSATGTSIWQILSPFSTGSQKQLPPAGATLDANYNSIELLTSTAPDLIFSNYIQTFNGARAPNNDEVDVVVGTTPPVTQAGQDITFVLNSWISTTPWPGGCGVLSVPCTIQRPFSVQVERFDSSAHTISAVTLQGHPLSGWRYWRVFSVGTNDVVVETGAVVSHGPTPLNYIGYFLFKSNELKSWQEYLEFIKKDLNAPQGSNPAYNIVGGVWNPRSPSQTDILMNVCNASTCD